MNVFYQLTQEKGNFLVLSVLSILDFTIISFLFVFYIRHRIFKLTFYLNIIVDNRKNVLLFGETYLGWYSKKQLKKRNIVNTDEFIYTELNKQRIKLNLRRNQYYRLKLI